MGLEDINIKELFEIIKKEQIEHNLIQERISDKAGVLFPSIKEHFMKYVQMAISPNLPRGVTMRTDSIKYTGENGYNIRAIIFASREANLPELTPQTMRIIGMLCDTYSAEMPWLERINVSFGMEE